jgi:hypothetical protein
MSEANREKRENLEKKPSNGSRSTRDNVNFFPYLAVINKLHVN